MHYKAFKIRLEPNKKQATLCSKHAGTARHAYNDALAYCNELYEQGVKTPSAIDLHKWLVATIKKDNEWYYEISKFTPQQSLRDLETAFKNFHRLQKKSNYNLKNDKGALQGFPKFKKKRVKDKFYLEGAIKIENNKIKLPKLGWVKLSENIGSLTVKNCTVSRKAGEWFVAFKVEHTPTKTKKKFDVVGVDLGIKTLATLSNGEVFKNLRPYKKAKDKLRKQQKEVSRRFVKGAENQSKNYKKSVLKLAKTHAMVANVRKDTLHKLTTYLAKNFETVVIEDLKVKNMTKNHNLASAILDGGFFEFKRQLLYKKEWYGGSVILANTFYASSKLCSCCGNKKHNLKLSERQYACSNCGTKIDRDFNASKNLEKLASSSIAELGNTNQACRDQSSFSIESQLVVEAGIKHQMFTFG